MELLHNLTRFFLSNQQVIVMFDFRWLYTQGKASNLLCAEQLFDDNFVSKCIVLLLATNLMLQKM
jgi:hypothetical protein